MRAIAALGGCCGCLAHLVVGTLLQQDYLELGPSRCRGSVSYTRSFLGVLYVAHQVMAPNWWNKEGDEADWKSSWFQCVVCGTWNEKKKGKCWQCGIKKSFATDAKFTPPMTDSWRNRPVGGRHVPTLGDYWPPVGETIIAKTPAATQHTATSQPVDANHGQHKVPSSADVRVFETALKELPVGPLFA